MYVCLYACMNICTCIYLKTTKPICPVGDVRMYVCMCVWLYVCVCMYVCMYVCMNLCMYICMHVYAYVCEYAYMCIFIYIQKYTYLYLVVRGLLTWIRMMNSATPCQNLHTYIPTHTHTHTYIHTHTFTYRWGEARRHEIGGWIQWPHGSIYNSQPADHVFVDGRVQGWRKGQVYMYVRVYKIRTKYAHTYIHIGSSNAKRKAGMCACICMCMCIIMLEADAIRRPLTMFSWMGEFRGHA